MHIPTISLPYKYSNSDASIVSVFYIMGGVDIYDV